MPDHPPTQPAPMSEDELKAIESLSNSFKPGPGAAWALVEAIDKLVPEVRRLNAAQRELSLEIVSAFGEYQMAFDERDRLQSELTAVRAAVEEESQRADRAERVNANQLAWVEITNEWCESEVSRHEAARKLAEAAARELREKLMVVGGESLIKYQPEIEALLASTAWLTGGNEQPITEEGKGNGK